MKKRGKKIKLLLVDDHPIVREGLKSHLATQPDLEVVGDAANGLEAIDQARQRKPDVVLMDISMPRMSGLEAITRLRRQSPKQKILILTMHENREYIARALRLGACGYVLKDSAPAELVRAIKSVHAGEAVFGGPASAVLLEELARKQGRSVAGPESALSDREREVLVAIAEGQGNKEIATKLGVSVRTIETHRERIMSKLSIRTVAGLTKFAIAQGLVDLR